MSTRCGTLGRSMVLATALATLGITGDALAERYSLSDDGLTVTDVATGLVWQRNREIGERTWRAALEYCEGLSLAEHTDWRLPNIRELGYLPDRSRTTPAIDPLFGETGPGYLDFWSSTSNAGNPGQAWVVRFEVGTTGTFNGNKTHHTRLVRCVRGPVAQLETFSLNVSLGGTGSGAVTSQPAAISCPGACQTQVAADSEVTLTALADEVSTFDGWGGDCTHAGVATECTLTMSAHRNVTAEFNLRSHTVTAEAGPGGDIQPPSRTVNHGDTTSFLVTTGEGYSIDTVVGCGGSLAGNTYTTAPVTESCHVVASFTPSQMIPHLVVVTAEPAEGGTVTGGGSYPDGVTVTVAASPQPGYEFVRWTEEGSEVWSQPSYVFTIVSDRNLVAHFSRIDQTVPATIPTLSEWGLILLSALLLLFGVRLLRSRARPTASG